MTIPMNSEMNFGDLDPDNGCETNISTFKKAVYCTSGGNPTPPRLLSSETKKMQLSL
jgi:hypothetical protein